MDTIIAAIIAALGNLAEPVVKDAYGGLKGLISRKMGERHPVVIAVEQLEAKPGSVGRRETLKEEIDESGIGADAEIAAAAKALLESAEKIQQTSVRQTVTGDGNIFSGTGNVNVNRSV